MKEQEETLVYYSKYARPLRGCMSLFMFLSLAVVVALLAVIHVEMPKPLPPAQEGTLRYRNHEALYRHVLMRSAMPLPLPQYVDPARRDEAAAQALPQHFVPTLSQAPAKQIFSAAHDSAVLKEDELIALPPQGLQDAPPTLDGKEVQP